jgi:hypothetical protein
MLGNGNFTPLFTTTTTYGIAFNLQGATLGYHIIIDQ